LDFILKGEKQMQPKLLVTPQELTRVAGSMRSARSNMDQIMSQMLQNIQNLRQNLWDSAAGNAFLQQFQNVTRNCQGALQTMDNHIENLAKTANVYEQLEAELKSKASSLDSSNIFS
jgi:WXG100 family type VII secretion target